MKNNKKNYIQNLLFEQIQKTLPANVALVNEISDSLKIGVDSAYRRIRGDKLINFEETVTLCRHFGISLDLFLSKMDKNTIQCIFAPLDINDFSNYLTYAQELLAVLENIKSLSDGEIILSAADIPAFHFLAYKELTYFYLFSWNKNICNYKDNFEEMCKILDSHDLVKYYEKININYQQIPSTEVWTANTIDPIIKLLNYHSEMKHFNDKQIPLLICEQLLDLMNKVQNRMNNSTIGSNRVPYKFYISEIDIGNTYILFKKPGKSNCLIRLFTINGLNIVDEKFCQMVENWIYNLTKRSVLISGTSEKEGFKFFDNQKEKIKHFMKSL